MAVPDYQSLMLPLLESLQDGEPRHVSDVKALLATRFDLTDEDLTELLPSGNQPKFDNRIGWARTYLKKAGLLQSPQRGVYQITLRGKEALEKRPAAIDERFLEQYEEFLEFKRRNLSSGSRNITEHSSQTPEEILEKAYQTLRESLSQEILERIRQAPPRFFEQLVVELLLKMGYGGSRQDAGSAIGRTGDGGIDGIIKEDKLGLDVIYLQAKRWGSTVGRPQIQAFVGSLEGHRAQKGVFITTSKFSPDAVDYVSRIGKKIVLIDGHFLSELMIDHGLGVTSVASYSVQKIDSDYFSEE